MERGAGAAACEGDFHAWTRLSHFSSSRVSSTSSIFATWSAVALPAEEYYCPPLEVIDSERTRDQRGHFNLIHHETGFKADIYLVGSDELHRGGNSAAFFIPASSPPRGSLSQSHAPIVCGLELPTDADQGRGGEGSSRAHRSRSGDVRPHGIPARQCCRGWFHL